MCRDGIDGVVVAGVGEVCVSVCVCVSVSVYRVGWASLMVEWRATGDDERG